MKKQIRFYALLMMYVFTMAAPIAFAATDRSPSSSAKEFTFKYQYKNDRLEIKTKSNSWEEAFQMASQQCFTKLTKNRDINYDTGMDVIDVCANPR